MRKSPIVEGACTIGFVYFFEDVETEDSITGGTHFNLTSTERALEEDALFQIREAYKRTSMKHDAVPTGLHQASVGPRHVSYLPVWVRL